MNFPKDTSIKPKADKIKYNRFHISHDHLIEDSVYLKDAIKMLIREIHLAKYTKRDKAPRRKTHETKRAEEDRSPDVGPIQVSLYVSRPEDFEVPKELSALFPWEKFPLAMVIIGGGLLRHLTIRSVKGRFDELIGANSNKNPTLNKFKGKSEPITFYLEEFPEGSPNSSIPLLIQAKMANFDVHRILVDQGSSVDIIYF